MLSDTPTVVVDGLGKVYRLYDKPIDRLKQLLWPGKRTWGREFKALEGVSFTLKRGDVLGLIGKNGAGKSTLLQMICGTLTPSAGHVQISGRVAALLELGAGFNPDFTGRENIYLNGAVLGLSQQELDERYDEIVNFAGIGNFIHQPVKTYSSGMYVRLAFSIATSVDPDILVVDEALSVGDGEFARKSFDRIMELKARGTTILFCSHSLFQVESICTSAIWLHDGQVAASGAPADVVSAYQEFLQRPEDGPIGTAMTRPEVAAPKGHARLLRIGVNGQFRAGSTVALNSLTDDLTVEVGFSSDPALPSPSVAVTLMTMDGRTVASAGSWNDGVTLERNKFGQGVATLTIGRLPLLKGRYHVSVYLFCERGLHWYAVADQVFVLEVRQQGAEQGMVHVPHQWTTAPDTEVQADALTWLTQRVQGLPLGSAVTIPEDGWLGPAPTEAMLNRFGLTKGIDGSWLKNKEPRWQLRWVQEGDRAAWTNLFASAFGFAMAEELRAWKYQHTTHMGVGAYAGEQMVAFYGGMPRAIRMRGQDAMAVQIGDVMVHPEHRGVMTRQGAFQMAAATFLEQQIGYGRPYLLGYGFPAFKSMALAKHLGLYEPVDELLEWRWNASHTGQDLITHYEAVTSLNEGMVDALWKAMANDLNDSIVGVRDSSYLTHRYLMHPVNAYDLLLVKAAATDKTLGVLVMSRTHDSTFEVLDWVGELSQLPFMLNAAAQHALAKGAQLLTAWITKSHAHLMTMPNSETVPTGLAIPTNSWTPGPPSEEVANRWFLMGGDTDFK